MPVGEGEFSAWYAALEARHLAALSFSEVRRALQALSSLYVERRDRLRRGAALQGAGKRAAFALFYGSLHFLLVREIVHALGAARPAPRRIVDLGCGIGAAGAAWALACRPHPTLLGVDGNAWAVEETRWTYRSLGLAGEARRGDLRVQRMGGAGEAVLVAFTANELGDEDRARLLAALGSVHERGAVVLVVEPLARRGFRWWDGWSEALRRRGGREDTWRFRPALPERLRLLDRAAGMDHQEIVGRSLYLPAPRRREGG
jgi:hypothetical protein